MRICALLALLGCGRISFGTVTHDGGDGTSLPGGDAMADGPPIDVVVSNLCPNATPIATGSRPSIAFTGSNYGVVYIDNLSAKFVPVAFDGTPGTPVTLHTVTAAPTLATTAIVWDGSELVAAYAMDGIYGAVLAPSGAILNADTQLDAVTTAIQPVFATGGGALRLQYSSTSSGYQQYTRTVTASPLSSSAGTQISNSAAGNGAYDPALAWTGTAWSAFWDDSKFQGGCYQHGIFFDQIKANGMLGGADVMTYQIDCNSMLPTERHSPFAVWNGSDISLVWIGTATQPDAVVVARAAANTGALISGPQVATSGAGNAVAAVWTGSELGLAWTGNGVFLTRTDLSGNPIAELTFDSAGITPAIAFDGLHYALVWERGGVIYFSASC